jgi:formylglycine-generating enzyme required for sulfatase activity
MAGKIFINYRRTDAEAWADRVFERLKAQLPDAHVFMDIDGNIPLGLPWATWLDSQVAACDLMLVLIGRAWVTEFEARSGPGERDYVRVEIESALTRRIPVVPVFLGDAPVPSPDTLPASIRSLLELQAARLQRASFETDARVLIDGVVRSIKLARAEEDQAASITPVSPSDQYRAEGRIKVDALINCGAPDGWFKPGAGITEWFKDHDAGPEMVVVPAGSFVWKEATKEAEQKVNEITIARPFAISRYVITRGQFAAFVNDTGYRTEGSWWRSDSWHSPGFPQDDSYPVVCMHWDYAKAYAEWLTQQSGRSYRLLSETEWEYAARAGREKPVWWGPKEEDIKPAVPVDSFDPNPWGLYNVHGIVWQWCEDAWSVPLPGDLEIVPDRKPSDGSAWAPPVDTVFTAEDGTTISPAKDKPYSRILRGGLLRGEHEGAWEERASLRMGAAPDTRLNAFGFRVARTLSQ